MPAPRETVAVLKVVVNVVILLCLLGSVKAQTSVNDIHVVPRQLSPSVANTVAATQLVDGSLLHVLKTEAKLVLVPVSVTDQGERLVSGLRAENFELFDGKKPQEIKHFSSEDAPVSIGLVLDASGSMHDKM